MTVWARSSVKDNTCSSNDSGSDGKEAVPSDRGLRDRDGGIELVCNVLDEAERALENTDETAVGILEPVEASELVRVRAGED